MFACYLQLFVFWGLERAQDLVLQPLGQPLGKFLGGTFVEAFYHASFDYLILLRFSYGDEDDHDSHQSHDDLEESSEESLKHDHEENDEEL